MVEVTQDLHVQADADVEDVMNDVNVMMIVMMIYDVVDDAENQMIKIVDQVGNEIQVDNQVLVNFVMNQFQHPFHNDDDKVQYNLSFQNDHLLLMEQHMLHRKNI